MPRAGAGQGSDGPERQEGVDQPAGPPVRNGRAPSGPGQETILKSILDSMGEGVLVYDTHGEYMVFNPEAQRILGRGPTGLPLQDRPAYFGLHRPDQVTLYTAEELPLVRAMRGESLDGEEAFVRNDARPDGVWISLAARPLRDPDGRIIGGVLVMRDITDRKRAESLGRAKEAAEAASRLKTEFLSTVSHELRTPLTAIMGISTLLLDSELTPEQREFVETIAGSGQALLGIINELLDLSRLEAGGLALEPRVFDLRGCVREAMDQVAARAAAKHLDLVALFAGGTPRAVFADDARVRQVLVNLLSNAVKFTSAGEVVVEVSSRPAGPPLLELKFEVRDTGPGIPKEKQSLLFRPFSQVDASSTRRHGGTGLGLAISRRLAELMGGNVTVDSDAGRGASFAFTMAARASSEGAEAPMSERRETPLAGKTLLVVDDSSSVRRSVESIASRWGMKSLCVGSAAEALEALGSAATVDLAFIDYHLRGMDGPELGAEIRRRLGARSPPLVLAVCLGSRDEEGMAAQFDGLATKPLKEMGLFEALLAASEGGRERTEIGRPAGAFDGKMGERHPLRILLAEDSQVNQYVMLRMLSRLGYWAEVADNGREAVLALERSEFDVVLMDVMMPDMDGLEATKVIRERFAEDRRPTVVAVTAYASQGDRERFLRAGMDGYICKPVKVEELVAALEDVNPRVEANMGRPGPVRDGAEAATIEAGDARSRTTVGRRSAEVGPGSFLRGMGVEYAAELAEAFSMEGEAMVARMRQAARTGDAEGLGRAAHTLKSSSMDVRAVELSSLCAELESRSRSGVPQDADRAITRVLELFEDARARLRRDLGRPS